MTYPCASCGGSTHYMTFSGGREWQCDNEDCGAEGEYDLSSDNLPRAVLLQSPKGVTALRAQMDQELARRRDQRITATCVHDDGFEHPSDGSLPCSHRVSGVSS